MGIASGLADASAPPRAVPANGGLRFDRTSCPVECRRVQAMPGMRADARTDRRVPNVMRPRHRGGADVMLAPPTAGRIGGRRRRTCAW